MGPVSSVERLAPHAEIREACELVDNGLKIIRVEGPRHFTPHTTPHKPLLMR